MGGENIEKRCHPLVNHLVGGLLLKEYVRLNGKILIKDEIDLYVKSVSKVIVDNIGRIEYGPAAR